jgi:hypothetical protein
MQRGLVSPRGTMTKSADSAKSSSKLLPPSGAKTPLLLGHCSPNQGRMCQFPESCPTQGWCFFAAHYPPTEKDKARVDAEFLEMMKQQGIPQEQIAKMASALDYNGKSKMLEQHQQKQVAQKKSMKTPAWFVAQLKAAPDVELLRNLKTHLTTEAVTWLRSFYEGHGLTQLTSYLVGVEKDQQRNAGDQSAIKECIYECCCIVEGISHSEEGLKILMDPSLDQLLKVSILCMDTTDSRRLIKLYSYFALLLVGPPLYYQRVVDGFHYFKTVKREPMNYFQLVETLKGAVSKELASKCMALINAFISAPDDLDTRVSQRTSFLRLGLRQVMLDVKTRLSDEEFDVQFSSFVDDEKEDQQQLQEIGLSSANSSITGDGGMTGNISSSFLLVVGFCASCALVFGVTFVPRQRNNARRDIRTHTHTTTTTNTTTTPTPPHTPPTHTPPTPQQKI